METTDISDKKKCKIYGVLDRKKLNIEWEIIRSNQFIYVTKLIPGSRTPEIKWEIYDKDRNLLYEELIGHSIISTQTRAYDKVLIPYRINDLYSKSFDLDMLNRISTVELYEIEKGCIEYESNAAQKNQVSEDNRKEKIEYNCFIKNYSADRDDGKTRRAVQTFCKLVSEDPSLFQYIRYYYF